MGAWLMMCDIVLLDNFSETVILLPPVLDFLEWETSEIILNFDCCAIVDIRRLYLENLL